MTDWKFVDFDEVPSGPWATYGDNNTFVINRRAAEKQVAAVKTPAKAAVGFSIHRARLVSADSAFGS